MATFEDNQTVLKALLDFVDTHPLSNRIPLDPNVMTFAGGEFSHNWQDIFDVFYAFKAQFTHYVEQTLQQKITLRDVTVFVTYEPIIKFCLFYTLTVSSADLPTFVYIPVTDESDPQTDFSALDPIIRPIQTTDRSRLKIILGKKNGSLKAYLAESFPDLLELDRFLPFLTRRLGHLTYLIEPFPPKKYPENWKLEKLQAFNQLCKQPVYQTGNLTACHPLDLPLDKQTGDLAGFRLNIFLTTLFYMFRDRIIPADYISCLEQFPDQITGKISFFDPNQEEWRTGIGYFRYIEGRYEGVFIGDEVEKLVDGKEIPLPEVSSISPISIVHLEKFSRRYRNRTAKFHNRTVVRGTYRNHTYPVIGIFKTNSGFPIVDLDFITVPFVLFDQLDQIRLDIKPVDQIKELEIGDDFTDVILRNGCLLPVDGTVAKVAEKTVDIRLPDPVTVNMDKGPIITVAFDQILQSDQIQPDL